jgi:hypothetical protein
MFKELREEEAENLTHGPLSSEYVDEMNGCVCSYVLS